MDGLLVEVTRGQRVESIHRGHIAVVNAEGSLSVYCGDPDSISFVRSCAEPFQAVPMVESGAADAFGFSTEELAQACSSHSGTQQHQDIVRSMLRKSGLDESRLQCGFARPIDEMEGSRVRLGLEPESTVQCECSGAHAGMVAACRHMGWPLDGYMEHGRPLQDQIVDVLSAVTGVAPNEMEPATDGCSIPTYAAPLRSFARAYAVLANPEGPLWDASPKRRGALMRLRDAMATHPVLISEEGDVDTAIMDLTEGRVIAKLGAEGMLCLAIPEHGLGVAIRESSGASRALGPIGVGVIEALGIESPAVIRQLREALVRPVKTFSGSIVGETRPTVSLLRS